MRHFSAFIRDESGSNTVEYGLIASIISVIALGSMYAIGFQVDVFYNDMLTSLQAR